jgi:hypothetical protein
MMRSILGVLAMAVTAFLPAGCSGTCIADCGSAPFTVEPARVQSGAVVTVATDFTPCGLRAGCRVDYFIPKDAKRVHVEIARWVNHVPPIVLPQDVVVAEWVTRPFTQEHGAVSFTQHLPSTLGPGRYVIVVRENRGWWSNQFEVIR